MASGVIKAGMYTLSKNLTFVNGLATIQDSSVTTSSRILATCSLNTIVSIAMSSCCSTNGTINVYAFNTSTQVGYSGNLPITLLVDNR